jgi:acetate kinase
MKILVMNCGSSSLKYQLIDMENEEVLAKGLVERIGIDNSNIKHTRVADKAVWEHVTDMPDHTVAIELVIKALTDPEHGVVSDLSEIDAVGHRTVHAGEKITESVLATEENIAIVESLNDLAPLHNPACLAGIKGCMELMPGKPMGMVFDTAFHSTMPAEAYIYPIPYEYYEKYGVRKYGFHGTSHKYVSRRAAEILGKDIKDLKIITLHLGNGASLAAVKNGKVVDTSMGFTPLAGIAMGGRSGNIDPAILFFLADKENLSLDDLNTILNKKSGILGVSGVSSDFRDIHKAEDEGNERAKLALEVYVHRVKSYLGAYIAIMNGVDALVFTAGVGENDALVRKMVCSDLENLGIKIDEEKNNQREDEFIISADDSPVKVMHIATNEELMIARDTMELIQ